MMSAHCVFELRFCIWFLVLPRDEEAWFLDSIHLHELLTGLGHRLISLFLSLQIQVEILKLIVFLEDVLNIGDLHRSRLSDFFLLFIVEHFFGIVFFVVIHGRAYFVLSLEHLDFSIFTPDHQFEGRLLLQTVQHTFLKIVHSESVLRQKVFDIVLESFFVWFFLAFLHRLHEGACLHLSQEIAGLHRESTQNVECCLRLKKHHHFY